jgi:hypothetical protein
LRDSGVVLLELPIEYGPILLANEWGRKFLKGRSSQYGTGELLAAAFLGKISDRHARYEASDDRTFISPHHGFDINRLIRELKSIGTPKEILRSPFAGLPRWLNQTVLFSFQLTERSPSKIEAAVLAAN